jgi:methylglutaconyl-CoA hydratase
MPDEAYSTIRVAQAGSVRRITLFRPEVRNAFNDQMIDEITRAFRAAAGDAALRIVVLGGEGGVFCAGADLDWMRAMAAKNRRENLEDAKRLAAMLAAIDGCPKAVIGRVHGAAFGGACGLVACCDVVLASDDTRFAFSEVKLGLVPATIAPYVVRKIGVSAARRYFVTGERMSAADAARMGLVHVVVPREKLDDAVNAVTQETLGSGPGAVAEAKSLIHEVTMRRFPEVNEYTARLIAEIRATIEAREGMAAFLEKRKPSWAQEE